MRFCVHCGAEARGARYCGQCGAHIGAPSEDGPPFGGFDLGDVTRRRNVLGALAYLTPIPALAFLVFEPYGRDRFIRFHSYQCLFLTLVAVLLAGLSGLVSIFALLESLLTLAFQILLLAAWAKAAYEAYRGEEFRLPVIGTFAMRHAEGTL